MTGFRCHKLTCIAGDIVHLRYCYQVTRFWGVVEESSLSGLPPVSLVSSLASDLACLVIFFRETLGPGRQPNAWETAYKSWSPEAPYLTRIRAPPLTRHLEFFTVPTQLSSPPPPNPTLKSFLPSPPSSALRVFHHLPVPYSLALNTSGNNIAGYVVAR